MALNLSTLTNPATSASILNEALTTADLLDPVPILKNLSRGSNKGGDAKQTTALNQPRALPLIKNPSGNLGGYLYIPDVSGNYATVPSVTIGSNQTWQAEVDMVITQFGNYILPMGGGLWSSGFGVFLNADQKIRVFSKNDSGTQAVLQNLITLGTPFNLKYGFDGTNIYADIDDTRAFEVAASSNQANSISYSLSLNHNAQIGNIGNYAIQKAKLTVNNAVVFDCDFNGSTSIRHGDTKFQASVGGPVSLIKVGNDPVTVVKKSVLRFSDAANTGLQGLFGQTITEGYLFASFSVLGSGGDNYARLFIINPTGGTDAGHFLGFRLDASNTFRSDTGGSGLNYSNMYDDERGDVLYEYKFKSGDTKMRFNNATGLTSSGIVSCSAQEFSIAASEIIGDNNAALDLEYLALFDASLTTEQANSVRSFINKRNSVFYRWDTDGYYFYDAQKAPVGNITDVNTWSGRIVGSDNGDSASIIAQQATANDQPVSDGYVVTFADNADHLDIPQVTLAAGDSYAWMVCGTSLGTFSYKVTVSGETELNLLGHLGDATYRKAGDLYGIVLLPESATSADIEQARSLLIDRGAADGTSDGSITYYWRFRTDIVDFKAVDMSSATSVFRGWDGCSSMTSFGITQLSNCSNFTNAWLNCSSLQSFPAGAKLGTSASSVSFTSAWQSSGLTSFSTPLPKAKSMYRAFKDCTSLTDFSSDVFANWTPSILNSSIFHNTWEGCNLTAQSVENILTSIDSSGKFATSDGTSGGNALGGNRIDIHYDGTTLSAATNTAVDSLKSKGWSIVVNGVTL